MRKGFHLLVALLLVFPAGWMIPNQAEAEEVMTSSVDTATITVTEDVSHDGTYYPDGWDNSSYNEPNIHVVGFENWFGERYVYTAALKFDMSGSNIAGVIQDAKLVIPIVEINETNDSEPAYIDIYETTSDAWLEEHTPMPTPILPKIANIQVPDEDTTENYKIIKIDITSHVLEQLANNDQVISLLLKGRDSTTDPSNFYQSLVVFMDKKAIEKQAFGREITPTDVPHLEITYQSNSPPTGTIKINNDVPFTNSKEVKLHLTASDPENDPIEVEFSNDNVTWSPREPFESTKPWTLTDGDGTKTVYYKVYDGKTDDLARPTYSDTITLDQTPPTGTFTINSNLSVTNSRNVTLNIDSYPTDTTQVRFSNQEDDWTGSSWQPISNSKTWKLSETDGEKTVYMQLQDEAGNKSETYSATITLDQSAPTGTIEFTNGTHTNNPAVNITIEAEGQPAQMRFKQDSLSWEVWEAFTTTKTFELTGEDGTKTVFMQLQDQAGNISNEISATIILDRVAPSITGISEGAQVRSAAPTFTETNATLNGEPFVSGTTITTEGPHILIVKDQAGNMTTINFIVDRTNPTGSLQINENANLVNTQEVTLSIDANDENGVSEMRISNNETFSDEVWEPFTTTKPWTIPDEDGDKTVYVELRDQAGNTVKISDVITLDQTAPTGTVTIENSKTIINKTEVSLTITGEDDHEPIQVRFSDNNVDWSTWEDFSALSGQKTWNLPAGDGPKTIYMQLKDAAGNIVTIDDTIVLDQTNPTITGVTDGLVTNGNVTINFSDGPAFLNGDPYDSGETITQEGTYTIVVWDEAENQSSATFTIDKTAPSGAISINNGATITNNEQVELSYEATDNLNGNVTIQFSDDGDNWSTAQTVNGTGTYDWTLPLGDGTKTVHLKIQDEAGNFITQTAQITLDQTNPTAAVSINGETEATSSPNVTLSISGTDANPPLEMRIAATENNWSEWEPFSSEKEVTLPAGDGDKTVSVQIKDAAGNISLASDTIELDTTPPVLDGLTDGFKTKDDVTISFNEGTADLNGIPISNNHVVSEDGIYNVIVTDKVGLTTTVSFTIDKTPPTGRVVINDEDLYTKNGTVSLVVEGTDLRGAVEMRIKNEDNAWAADWQPVSNVAEWDLSAGDGEKTIQIELRDEVGNVTNTSDSIILDTTKPEATVVINNNAEFTTNPTVTITATATDTNSPVNQFISTDQTNWQPFESSTTLTGQDGTKSIYLKAVDPAGNETIVYDSIILDTTAPVGDFEINGGDEYTNNPYVSIRIVDSQDANGPLDVKFMNQGGTWTDWQEVTTADLAWILPDGEGEKTIQMVLRDQAGLESTPIEQTIILDTVAPVITGISDGDVTASDVTIQFDEGTALLNGTEITTRHQVKDSGDYTLTVKDLASNTTSLAFTIDKIPPTGSLVINQNDERTNDPQVELTISGTDDHGPLQMRISNDEADWSSWESYNTSRAWNLLSGDGEKTVYLQLRDSVGNTTESITASIILDTTGPTGTITINDGNNYTNTPDVALTLTSVDPSGVTDVRYSNDEVDWSDWESSSATKNWTLSTIDGEKTVYVEMKDTLGNTSTVSDTIILDTTPPVVTGVTDGSMTNTEYVISFNEGTATLNDQPFVSGTTVDEEGEYTLVVMDPAGNITTRQFLIDKTPPTGAIEINDGKNLTNNQTVQLTITGDDPHPPIQMRFSNEDNVWSDWEPYAMFKEWQLTDGDGEKTVYVELQDHVGNTDKFMSRIELDTTGPLGTIVINDNAIWTNNPNVSLATTSDDINGPVQMRFSNDTVNWSDWADAISEHSWTLSAGDEDKTVYMELRDALDNVSVYQDTIKLDTTPPNITGVLDGEKVNENVTISFNEGTATLNGQPFTNGTTISDEGEYNIIVTDEAGNFSTASFALDKTPPTGTISVNNGDAETLRPTVDLQLTSADIGVQEIEMRFSNDQITWSAWESAVETKSWQLDDSTYGEKVVYVELRDGANNTTLLSDAIIYKSVPVLHEKTVAWDEDHMYTFKEEDFDFTNDDGTPLQTIKILSLPENGVFQIDETEITVDQEIAISEITNLTFTPNENWNGDTTVTWNGTDGSNFAEQPATITLHVNPVNDKPVAQDLEFSTTASRPVQGMLTADDIEEDALTFEIVEEPERGNLTLDATTGQFRFVPQSGNYGRITFTYRAFDGTDYSEPATVTVLNRVPPPPPRNPVEVMEGGSPTNQQVKTTQRMENGQSTLTITFEEDIFSDSEDKMIDLEIKEEFDNIETEFLPEMLRNMQARGSSLQLKTPNGTYQIPTQSFQQDPASEYFEDPTEIQVTVQLKRTPEDVWEQVQEALGNHRVETYIPDVQYEVFYKKGGEQQEIHQFDQAVSMTIPLPAGVNPTSAAMLMPDGTLRHVPASFEHTQSGTVATIKTFMNGKLVFLTDTNSDELASKGILDTSEINDPTDTSRSLFAIAVSKILGIWGDNGSSFTDVTSDQRSKDIQTAVDYGLVTGYNNEIFRPDDVISREHAMVIFHRALQLANVSIRLEEAEIEKTLQGFKDAELLPQWIREAAAVNVKLGIFYGNQNSEIMPKGHLTKSQLLAVLQRFLNKLKDY
ncbi:hypothetical protein GCM10008967_07700 [Bacillus carboniphilus]|uniref:SLH domain-containing protein n=1 Tax=Bacillus carboniphilus TaxID=86663 RepID=A0ABN0VXC5_9BACI